MVPIGMLPVIRHGVAFNTTESDLLVLSLFAATISSLPSLLRSASAMESGPIPTGQDCSAATLALAAPGAVVLRNTDTRLPLSSAAIRSGLPSPLP